MHQLPINFDVCRSRHRGSPESVAAKPRDAAAQRKRVLAEVAASGVSGLTCDELATKWGTTPNAISGRFTELKMLGRIAKIATRKARSGKMAAVYVSI